MGISASKQWNEMNEINQALEEAAAETERQRKASSEEKKSLKSRFKTKILKSGKIVCFQF